MLKYIYPFLFLTCSCTTSIRPKTWSKKVTTTSLNNLYQVNDILFRSEQPSTVEMGELAKLGIK